ncbi:MAG: CYTH domain-containing protein [archaeon]|jgi:adenylate cyclase class 2
MGKEYETQVLDVNPTEIAQKLRALGAREEKEHLQKRFVFDIKCLDHENSGWGEWVRLREANGKTTITYKNKTGTAIDQTEEIEFTVSDFNKASELLSKLKCFTGKYYQENKRHKFILDSIEFTLDTWPRIPTLLEIEAKSKEEVEKGLALLGLTGKDIGHEGILRIYAKYGIDLHSFTKIKFE